MPSNVFTTSPLFWVRVAALLFTCVAFSIQVNKFQPGGGIADWCIFCWTFSFACTLLVLLVEQSGLQAPSPVSWTNFSFTVACYAALFCLSASIIFPVFYIKDMPFRILNVTFSEVRSRRITSTVFSFLAAVAYMVEVSLIKARPREVAGYMTTAPGLLKVCQTFVACIIFVLVSNPVSYDHHPALKWCMAVYCICFILSMAVVVLCVFECTDCLPIPFSMLLSVYELLAVIMYLSATIIWPFCQFDKYNQLRHYIWTNLITVAALTGLNFLLYLVDLACSARLVFVTA